MGQVKICNKVIDNTKYEFLAKTLDDISGGKEYLILIFIKIGMLITTNYFFFTGQCLNQSLLILVRLIWLKKGDSIGKKEYYEKLLKSVENDYIKIG